MVWTCRAQHRLDCRSTQAECGCTEKIWQAKEIMGWSAWEWQKEARYRFCWPSKSFWVERTPSRKTCQKAQPSVEENRALKWIWWWWWWWFYCLSSVSWGIPILNVQECQSCSQFQSYSFLLQTYKLFRAHSEGLHTRSPKQNCYIPGLDTPVLYMLPLLPLVDKDFISGSQVRLAWVQILLTCISSQIICYSDPKILDTFDIFEDCPIQGIRSMDLFDPFPCYLHHIASDRLKSHTPFPWPASQLIYIILKFQCVLCILNFSVANTVIHKESYFRINICWDFINVQRKQQGTKDSALWNTRQNRDPIQFCSIYKNALLSVAQKRICPFQSLPTCAAAKQYALKELVRWGVKCFLKICQFVLHCPRF